MDKKILFNEALTSLVDFAAANANHVTMDDVKLYFKDLIDDDSQYQFIYDYLALNKVEVEGFTPPANNPLADDAPETSADETILKLFLFLTMLNQKKNYLLLRCIWKKWKPFLIFQKMKRLI